MSVPVYKTITGRRLPLDRLSPEEKRILEVVRQHFETNPEWTPFGDFWFREFEKSGLPPESTVFRICNDLEARLGIAQGKVAPPDYRDYLADLIEERYGSRYLFCKETGIDPGHLSRVLASRAEFSLQTLQKIMAALHAALIVQPEELLREQVKPEDASRALAAIAA